MNDNQFVYKSIVADEATGLWGPILNVLRGVSDEFPKVATSDIEGENSNAVIIYNEGEVPDFEELSDNWNSITFSVNHDFTDLYDQCVTFLNDTTRLSYTQAYYSNIVMTNAAGHPAYLTVFYRGLGDS
ncbi:hypothetical protein [Pseudoalteromonas luteoviolacea]|uniref:hypothetical protein n=1 Tax=Pseudoalteromonas luteoviolacea TaxID=43657 RepID=UPI001B396EEE|nr:hypothetical protein [Pseudoalteromonas luteoviolacea]MBQ4835439.1 hypothetical protein [Pseudoalteromonas luteoviolacea]